MKPTGTMRRIDEFGRIMLPKEIRRTYRLHEGTPVEFFCLPDGIVLKKYRPEARITERIAELEEAVEESRFTLGVKKTARIQIQLGEIRRVLQEDGENL